jgi:hypothetical protein
MTLFILKGLLGLRVPKVFLVRRGRMVLSDQLVPVVPKVHKDREV